MFLFVVNLLDTLCCSGSWCPYCVQFLPALQKLETGERDATVREAATKLIGKLQTN